MPLIETEEAARRLARAIASDLSLYNEEKIVQGIQSDDLWSATSSLRFRWCIRGGCGRRNRAGIVGGARRSSDQR